MRKDFQTWASLDIATEVSGVALWRGEALVLTRVVLGLTVAAWSESLAGVDGVVIEDGYVGPNKRTGMVLAAARARVATIAEMSTGAEVWGSLLASEWGRLVGMKSKARAARKQEAVAMCRWLRTDPTRRPTGPTRWNGVHLATLRHDVTADECDAVLLGLAWLRFTEEA